MTVAIVDYGSGNLRSAAKAIERAARETGADDRVLVTSSPREVADADRIVLPGVGAFADCRAGLYGVPGMVDTLQRAVIEQGKPFLGICVGSWPRAVSNTASMPAWTGSRVTSCASIPARII